MDCVRTGRNSDADGDGKLLGIERAVGYVPRTRRFTSLSARASEGQRPAFIQHYLKLFFDASDCGAGNRAVPLRIPSADMGQSLGDFPAGDSRIGCLRLIRVARR